MLVFRHVASACFIIRIIVVPLVNLPFSSDFLVFHFIAHYVVSCIFKERVCSSLNVTRVRVRGVYTQNAEFARRH